MNKKMNSFFAFAGTAAIIISGSAMPVFAQSLGVNVYATGTATVGGVSAGVNANVSVKVQSLTKAQDRADKEIKRRIDALTALEARINNMQKLSASEKSGFASSLQAQITLMNDLQAKIAADVAAQSTSSLKADINSITVGYRLSGKRWTVQLRRL